jgi:hypothetical protein
MTRILLGMLGSNGDCLYVTAIARHIKENFSGCHLTWAISSLCEDVIRNNPDIDEIWPIPLANWGDMPRTWRLFEMEAHALHRAGRFDHVFLPQIWPERFANYDGTIRPSIFRNFGHPLTVPVDVTIRLDEEEIAEVDDFFKTSVAADASRVIMFECSSKSGQSFATVDLALELAEVITAASRKTAIIISTHEPKKTDNPRVIFADKLNIRQTARLTHFVDLFVGCGSGLTVVATSSAAKPALPNIQILSRYTSVYASFRHDFAYFGKPFGQFMELTKADPKHLACAILSALNENFETAKQLYDDPVPLSFDWYLDLIKMTLFDAGRYVEVMHSLIITANRFGWHPALQRFARFYVLPFLQDDPRALLPHYREQQQLLRAGLEVKVEKLRRALPPVTQS